MVTINGIPVFDARIDEEGLGMTCVSLVDAPAVLTDFQTFAEKGKRLMYSVQSEEKHTIYGVIMRADFPIYRYDEGRGEFYIVYKADTIRMMAERYLSEYRQSAVTIHHIENAFVGANMVQWFIKDSAKGINPEGFEDIADGSLFAEYHITDENLWNQIKEGTFKGFSLEGYFDLVPETDAEATATIVDKLKGRFKNMSKLTERVKAMMERLLIEMGSMTTDKGVIFWDTDADLQVGDSVFMQDDAQERFPAPAETYRTEDGVEIVVEGGKVTAINVVAVQMEEQTAPAPEAQVETPAETPVETPADPAPEAEPEPQVETPAETPVETPATPEVEENPLEGENTALRAENDAYRTRIAELEARVAELEAMPVATPLHEEEVPSFTAGIKTNDKGLNRLAGILGK